MAFDENQLQKKSVNFWLIFQDAFLADVSTTSILGMRRSPSASGNALMDRKNSKLLLGGNSVDPVTNSLIDIYNSEFSQCTEKIKKNNIIGLQKQFICYSDFFTNIGKFKRDIEKEQNFYAA